MVVSETKLGNSRTYLRRRLKRDHPDVYQRMIESDGKISANAAAIEAGIKPPTKTGGSVRYRACDVREYLESNSHMPGEGEPRRKRKSS